MGTFIYVFQPFGTYEDNFLYKTQLLLGYGVIIFVTYFPIKLGISFLLRKRRANLLSETLALFVNFMLVDAICFQYFITYINKTSTWESNFDDFVILSFAIGALPLLLVLFWRYFQAQHESLIQNQNTNHLSSRPSTIELQGQNRSEVYQFIEDDLVYLQSSGNYVEVFFKKENEIKSILIRGTLSYISDQLDQETFVNVHRSYLVNRTHFSKLRKEQGKGLLLGEILGVEVPVSRGNLALAEQIAKDFR